MRECGDREAGMALGCEPQVSGQVGLPGTRRTLHLEHSVSHPKAEKNQAEIRGSPGPQLGMYFWNNLDSSSAGNKKGCRWGTTWVLMTDKAEGFERWQDDGTGVIKKRKADSLVLQGFQHPC